MVLAAQGRQQWAGSKMKELENLVVAQSTLLFSHQRGLHNMDTNPQHSPWGLQAAVPPS